MTKTIYAFLFVISGTVILFTIFAGALMGFYALIGCLILVAIGRLVEMFKKGDEYR